MPSRYQRGGVFKVVNIWKGTFRVDTPEGKRNQKKVTIGTIQEFPTKSAARTRLAQIMNENEKPGTVEPTKKLFSDLVERWKAARGPALGKSTFRHYSNALRAYVLPHFKDRPYQEITNEEIQTFINQQAKQYSPRVFSKARGWFCRLSWAGEVRPSVNYRTIPRRACTCRGRWEAGE